MQRCAYIIIFCLLFFVSACAGTNHSVSTHPQTGLNELNYTIEPVLKANPPSLKITVLFQGNNTGQDYLILPSTWGGQQNLFDSISNLKALSAGTTILQTTQPWLKQMAYIPNSQVKIEYTLTQSANTQKGSSREYYRPIINQNYFHLIGDTFLVHPKLSLNTNVKTKITWKNIPSHWNVANSFGANKKQQTIISSLYELKFAVYVGGDFRITKKTIKGNSLYIALRDDWQFSDKELVNLVTTSLATQRDFWHDHKIPYYLVTAIKSFGPSGHYAGTSFTNSFALFLNTNRGISAPLKHLVTHELFHHWNGNKMKRAQPEESVFWFSEGFTEYFTRLINVKSGLINLNEYVTSLNRVLQEYHTSKAKHMTSEQITGHFWNNAWASRIPYLKGEILALNWDHKLRQNSSNSTLSKAMQELYEKTQSHHITISAQTVIDHMYEYLPQGVGHDINAYIQKGREIKPLAKSLGPCITLNNNSRIPQYELNQNMYAADKNRCMEYFE